MIPSPPKRAATEIVVLASPADCSIIETQALNLFIGIGRLECYIKVEGQLIKQIFSSTPMTPKWSGCSSNENGEHKSSLAEAVPLSISYFGSPAVNRMYSKKDGNVYKRRKTDKDSNSLTADEEVGEMPARDCTSEDHYSLVLPVVPSDAMISNLTAPILEHDEPAGVSLVPDSGYMELEPMTCLISARDLCIAILRKDGFISESRTKITTEEFTGYDDKLLKKPKSPYGKRSEGKVKSPWNANQRPHGMSHIEYMLKDTEPYVTGVRIGRDFQVEVPEWSGPTSSGNAYFEEPSKFDPTFLTKLNWLETNNKNRSSIGNWIQCREVLSAGDSDKPVVCGKWRR
ncbi:hypothetical protein GUJ93_ZPchr0014g47636 [Zizania palustris]|uniref:Uncharacterized protein n=1 Tax=Zizania palustris TaxID=103762 RepID=A0A8J5VRS0_ZIZPA|nr:hypothetical protein GUJ93_ZPchr0014g47636 [Zizania palustris]